MTPPTSPAEEAAWRDERSRNAAHQAATIERRRAAETARARSMIAEFVAAATAVGVPTERLVARDYGGRRTYRTRLQGWYLRKNRSVAVGTDGEFYLLTTAGSLRARVVGATLEPAEPPLVLGQGARDGESIDLSEALERALRGETHRTA
ncbi:hypothetical protein [Sanguibacter suaedae]|uniref:Uncharacterized protein n=1 Tax=Sanguibacter suaedae TaxID=2795737 RepID=A0A934M827_9MICO|nr:hypothetical protein [Sanguibacter suaedae]MBI9116082.1 hypothetical protein [Sanguibacter suaedae]